MGLRVWVLLVLLVDAALLPTDEVTEIHAMPKWESLQVLVKHLHVAGVAGETVGTKGRGRGATTEKRTKRTRTRSLSFQHPVTAACKDEECSTATTDRPYPHPRRRIHGKDGNEDACDSCQSEIAGWEFPKMVWDGGW